MIFLKVYIIIALFKLFIKMPTWGELVKFLRNTGINDHLSFEVVLGYADTDNNQHDAEYFFLCDRFAQYNKTRDNGNYGAQKFIWHNRPGTVFFQEIIQADITQITANHGQKQQRQRGFKIQHAVVNFFSSEF